jgi:hypothetical protein
MAAQAHVPDRGARRRPRDLHGDRARGRGWFRTADDPHSHAVDDRDTVPRDCRRAHGRASRTKEDKREWDKVESDRDHDVIIAGLGRFGPVVAHVERVKVFVVAIEDIEASVRTVELVKRHFPHLKIYARATDRAHARALRNRTSTT